MYSKENKASIKAVDKTLLSLFMDMYRVPSEVQTQYSVVTG